MKLYLYELLCFVGYIPSIVWILTVVLMIDLIGKYRRPGGGLKPFTSEDDASFAQLVKWNLCAMAAYILYPSAKVLAHLLGVE